MIPGSNTEDRENSPATVLVVDDEPVSLHLIERILKKIGFMVFPATGAQQALEFLGQRKFDLVISDLYMPQMDGIKLLEEMRRHELNTPFIIVTASGSIGSAVDAMRKGACDYLEKPYNPETLKFTVNRAIEHHRALSENRQIKEYLKENFTPLNIVTVCPAMKATLEIAAKVAASHQTTVAIYGESGTGKEVLAKAIHFASTGVPSGFVAVNCAAIPESLLESELFGHVRGAFTGADKDREGKFSLACGGTLFLDEIGDMPLLLQTKLLRVLEERTFEKVGSNRSLPADFRVIVATHRDLAEMVRKGTFREDLYHRINVVPLLVPPLRERLADIPQLTDHFLDQFRRHHGKSLPGISRKAIEQLTSYHWPGNIRELRNILEYAAILVSDELIRPEHLRINAIENNPSDTPLPGVNFNITLPEEGVSLEAITGQVLQMALQRCGGNKSQAAALLKVDRKRFYR
ncbi:sigma-54 dependent transcriptional regulator [Geobacter pelophilus]|uniref:Sigma-54 dependent transcriptional regulator n=1 Tax=Geoanaerobacter pelophilus TaxID=60036 RepID=A0AAW4L455_9BACT|nr:sigma-54 dependent transcriptional regulator [Geoanaerobacter pelophilus]MBT0664590.1 sigma-54 dependent transcriptional regulator [Geoanaerobacter pelophilus]